jgi:hypothetical protein
MTLTDEQDLHCVIIFVLRYLLATSKWLSTRTNATRVV